MPSLTAPLPCLRVVPALLFAILVLDLPASLPGLELSEDQPTLANTLQAQWRLAPLETVLAQLAATAGLPMRLSAGIKKRIASHEVVTLEDGTACSAAEVIQELEVVQDLQWSISGGTMLVETADEADLRPAQRQVCWQEDQPLIPGSNDGLQTTPQGTKVITGVFTPPDITVLVGQVAEDLASDPTGGHPADMISTASGSVLMHDHPHRIAVMQHRLAMLNRLRNEAQLVRVTFGVLKPEDAAPDGIIATAQADAVLPKLQQVRTAVLEVSGPGRPASLAEETEAHTIVRGLDIVSSSYEPQMETLTSGMRLQIQRLPSLVGPEFQISGIIEDDISCSQSHLEGGVTVTGNASFPNPMRHTIDLPTRWTWLPEARLAIPRHCALVMQTQLPSGHAVLLVQPGESSDAAIPGRFQLSDQPLPLAAQLAAIAMDCHAGLAISRTCQQQEDWSTPLALPLHPDWSALASALSALHIRLQLEGSRLVVDVAKDTDQVVEILPLWSLAPLSGSRTPEHLGIISITDKRCYQAQEFTRLPTLDLEALLQKFAPSLDTAHVYQIENGLMLYRGQLSEASHLIGTLAALQQAQVSGWWWRLYALTDDAVTASPQDILSAHDWATLKDSQRRLISSFASSADGVGEEYAGNQHRIIEEADIVQGLLEPIVGDVITGSRVTVRARQRADGIQVAVDLRMAVERPATQSSVLTQAGKEAITVDLPKVASSQVCREVTLPAGAAAILTSGGVRYALTCSPLHP
jgi:hypothetical protein